MNMARLTLQLLYCAAVVYLTTGCASTSSMPRLGPPQPVTLAPNIDAGDGWWPIRFRMDRPDEKTRWERDLLIAHRIAAPLIKAHHGNIDLWRFHRRAAKDKTGHQFSLWFYASAKTADTINQQIKSDPLVEQLLDSGIVREVITVTNDYSRRPKYGDTSDPQWSAVMRDNWPHYIMGVSRMWLGMIDQISQNIGEVDGLSLEELLNHYQQVNQKITQIWQQESYHALLHHLNAIYGYEAMVYWEKRWKSF